MENYSKQFIDFLNTFYSHKEIWDDDLKIEILQQEIDITKNPKIKYPPRGVTYFSPSSANSCNRELYLKCKRATKDVNLRSPIQSRWTEIGGLVGDTVQKTILKAEKHWEKIAGGQSPFTALRTEEGFPFWEDFVKRFVSVKYKGRDINFFGKPDGAIRHTETGALLGLEVKSKSTTPAQTSYFSMKGPKEDHSLQTAAYELMYPEINFETYLILYWNVAKKAWDADFEKDPDLRCFTQDNTEDMKLELLEKFHYVLECVDNGTPPPLELDKFNFNNFKVPCSLDLSLEEVNDLKQQVRDIKASGLPNYIKNNYFEAMKFIVDTRRAYGMEV
ncbi:MAG: hypothetical protein ACQEUT_18480 [Bacillota bacterium]